MPRPKKNTPTPLKDPTPAESSAGYVSQLVQQLTERYLAVLEETDPATVALLKRKFTIQSINSTNRQDEASRRSAKKQRMNEYIAFWNELDEDSRLALALHDAKINLLARMVRNMGTTDIVQAHNAVKPGTAGSIDYVLGRFRAEGVTARQLQKFIDENAQAWFSLTGHPTNPASVSYMQAQTDVSRVIANPAARPGDLDKALKVVRDTPIAAAHKTPLEEAEETLITLDVIYDSALAHRRLFEAALEKHGYADERVKIVRPMIRPCAWTLGDGDGNEKMTAKVLEEGITLHRRRVAERYAETCAAILAAAEKLAGAKDMLPDIKKLTKAIADRKAGAEALARQAEDAAIKGEHAKISAMLNDLAYLLRCFGLGFGKIDLRHNAVDVIEAVEALFHAREIMDRKRFSSLSLDEQAIILSTWLEDAEVIDILTQTTPDDLKGQDTALRILERLRVVGRNPDMCEKLIVAETTHPAHALAALLLLKISGNPVGTENSHIDLVILSESVADLVGIGNTMEVLLKNKTFRQHVAHRKTLLVMIAKSDTTRQDGRGEAEYAQYEAAVEIYRVADLMKQKYPELEPVQVSIKNGGGHALQRGGGRVTEIPAVHGRAAADARVTDIGPSTLTIQGQQQTILFCPGKTALGTLEALTAHNLYTKAGVQGEMLPPPFSKNINKQYGHADAWLYAKTAGRAFDRLSQSNPAIDELLTRAPWLAMKAGNVSSRPAKRGERQVGPGITPADAKGDNPKALKGRAISGERLTAHACLPVFSVLGLAEAMDAVRNDGLACMNPDKYGDALHHLYRAHKIHRDAARATVNAVAMADFDIAWPLLAGRERPPAKDVATLAAQFVQSDEPAANSPDVTLAFLEEYFLRTEMMTYEMVSGQKAKKTMRHGDALWKLWPELAQQVAHRDRGAEFARVIECYRTRKFDDDPYVPLSEKEYRTTQALYTAANVINAPVGILATRTRLEPVREVGTAGRTRFMRPQSYLEEKVVHLLKMPAALA